ncbi:hypothetical protein ACOMHN_008106 [Nucella lapillus]
MEAAAAGKICPETLVSLLAGGAGQEWGPTLVLDCRPFMVYNRGHVMDAINVHCPSILKRRSGGGVLPLENVVPGRVERERLVKGGYYGSVVVYDQCGEEGVGVSPDDEEEKDGGDNNMQSDLVTVLTTLRQEVGRRQPPRLCYLAGGYEAFKEFCPFLCVTQQFSPCLAGHSNIGSSAKDERQPVEILPHLLLGSGPHSSDLALLRRLGVTALVNVSRDCPNHFPTLFRYLHIPVRDSACADLTAWFAQANLFIDQVKAEGGRVLVHCHAGRSRSATICMAYLISSLHLSLDDAFEYVRSRREVIDPNLNFMRQLQDYHQKMVDQQEGSPKSGGFTFRTPFADFPQQPVGQTPREAVAPISLPSGLELGLLPPVDSACFVPPPSPATATDVQCFFSFAGPEFPPSGGSTGRSCYPFGASCWRRLSGPLLLSGGPQEGVKRRDTSLAGSDFPLAADSLSPAAADAMPTAGYDSMLALMSCGLRAASSWLLLNSLAAIVRCPAPRQMIT